MIATRRDRVVQLAGLLAVASTAATFLGWGRSGQRSRTSYELVDTADRAGVLPDAWAWSAPLLYLAPAVCGIVLVSVAARRASIAGLAATTLGGLVGAAAFLVIRSPLVAEPAAWAALVLGVVTTLGGVAVLLTAEEETAT